MILHPFVCVSDLPVSSTARRKPLGEKLADVCQRTICRLQPADIPKEPMRHAVPNIDLGVYARSDRPLDPSQRIVQQYLGVSYVHAYRWQT